MASNQFILPAGTYYFDASATAGYTNQHYISLKNVTDSTFPLIGSTEYSNSTYAAYTRSFISGEVTITSPKTFELNHYTNTGRATDCFGVAHTAAVNEVYALVKIQRIK